MGYVVLLILLLGATQLIGGVFHLYSFFICWFGVIRVFFYVLWSLHSWRSRWSSREGVKRYQNGWSTDTLGGFSEHVSEICLFHWWSFFSGESNTSDLGTAVLKSQIIRICKLLDIHIELQEFCYILGRKDMAAAIHGHGTRWRWVVSVMAQPFYHQRKIRCCSLNRMLWEFYSYVGYCALPGIKPSSLVVYSTA